ncbi:putative polyol transporter 4 [Ranunculus cassubicifolius]
MGLIGLPENENGEGSSNIHSGTKHNYRRMDAEITDEDFRHNSHNVKERTKRFVIACAIFASLNTVLISYDVGVMSGAIIYIQEDLNLTEVQEEVLVGILSFVSLLGSLAGGKASDAVGRKWTMGFAAVVFQAGATVMAFAPSFEVLMIGRLLAGIGIGFGIMIAPVYIAEISPTVARGSLTSYPEIFINVGILLGYVANYAFAGLPVHINWRIMLGVGVLPSVFIGLSLFVIPESPRWLVMKNRIDEARLVLLRTNENQGEIEERLADIQAAANSNVESKYEEKAVWRELLSPSPALRRMLTTGIGIQLFQQITGIDATVYYSPTIFKEAGVEGNNKLLAATIAVGFSKTIFILVAILVIDKVGRKPLLYVSTIGMSTCLFGLVLTLTFFAQQTFGVVLAILFVCGNVAFFSVGIGPICWVVTSEIFPLRVRAQASALGSVFNRVCSGVIAMSFLSACRAISVAGTFFIFTLLAAISAVFVHIYVPETKGKSLEEIEMMFQEGEEWKRREVEFTDVQHLVPRR